MKMNDSVAYERAKNQNAIHTCYTFLFEGLLQAIYSLNGLSNGTILELESCTLVLYNPNINSSIGLQPKSE